MIYGYEHAVQLSVFLKAAGCGYALGILYVSLEFIKFAGKRDFIPNMFRDVVFFAIASFFSFMFFLKFNSGIFRFYLFGGEAIGFLLFMIFPGEFLVGKINILHKKFFDFLEKIRSAPPRTAQKARKKIYGKFSFMKLRCKKNRKFSK